MGSIKVDLTGKVAIITGGARGIGEAIAMRFAENGAKVVIADIDIDGAEKTSDKLKEMKLSSVAIKVDVQSEKEVNQLVKKVMDKFGRINILVNNAGINTLSNRVPLHEVPIEEWNRIIAVDLTGVFLVSKRVIKEMLPYKRGKIINISSVVGLVPLRLQSAFVAAKAGITHLTKSMAIEYGHLGINVNAIAPGSIITDATRVLFYSDIKEQKTRRESLISHIPLGKPGEPEDISGTALFLASDDASYITGSIIVVDGGWSCGYMREW